MKKVFPTLIDVNLITILSGSQVHANWIKDINNLGFYMDRFYQIKTTTYWANRNPQSIININDLYNTMKLIKWWNDCLELSRLISHFNQCTVKHCNTSLYWRSLHIYHLLVYSKLLTSSTSSRVVYLLQCWLKKQKVYRKSPFIYL